MYENFKNGENKKNQVGWKLFSNKFEFTCQLIFNKKVSIKKFFAGKSKLAFIIVLIRARLR